MEWLFGIAIVWIIWRLLTGKTRREVTLKDTINRAYIASTQLKQNWITTPIYWEAARKFAEDRGADIDYENGSASARFDMLINNEKVSVVFLRNRLNGSTDVSARKHTDLAREGEAMISDFLNKKF